MQAKKKYGQNFLINQNIINEITNLINPNENDLLIEIGPGQGALTKYLAQKKSKLICIEIDKDMHAYLDKFENEYCHIIYDDILSTNLKDITINFDKIFVIGNLPYYITSPIIEYLINNLKAEKMIFMVQKEVANRYCAEINTKDYGYFTLYLRYFYNVKKEIFVSKDNFRPIPKVDSMVISLTKRNDTPSVSKKLYFNFLKEAFSHKRKTLKNNIKSYDFNKVKEVLNKYNLSDNVRAENIRENIYIDIVNNLDN